MCGVTAGLAALSSYMNYRQQQSQTNAQIQAYRAQADIAAQNAAVERRKQEQIADTYAQRQQQLHNRQRLAEGAQRAEVGASGLNFAGSSMDILSSGLDAYYQDKNNLLANQRNDNYATRVAETNYINQANSARTAAANLSANMRLNKFATILSTAASIYGMQKPWLHSTETAPVASHSNTGVLQDMVQAVSYYNPNNPGSDPMTRARNYGGNPFYRNSIDNAFDNTLSRNGWTFNNIPFRPFKPFKP